MNSEKISADEGKYVRDPISKERGTQKGTEMESLRVLELLKMYDNMCILGAQERCRIPGERRIAINGPRVIVHFIYRRRFFK